MHYIAPVQGHTDAAWRHFHSLEYAGNPTCFTPFIRIEKGEIRPRDLRDFTSDLNVGTTLVPQAIFKDTTELRAIIEVLVANGAADINLNMGCPFPLQTGKGRGAGLLAAPGKLDTLPDLLGEFPRVRFSVKMRLGYDSPDQWRQVLPILNRMNLTFIAIHPRTARQQYAGELHMGQFEEFVAEATSPIIFNGELRTPDDIADITSRYPNLGGVMCARGILARPSLFEECDNGSELPLADRLCRMLRFHNRILDHYESTLCGEAQILAKIKPFWEYAEPEIGHKAFKAIKKSTTLAKYQTALAQIL